MLLLPNLRHLTVTSLPYISSSPLFTFISLCHLRRRMAATATFPGEKRRPRLRGVVFDMDGTLTVPAINFSAMYRAVLGDDVYTSLRSSVTGGRGIDILHHIEGLAPHEQQRAYKIIEQYEREGLDRLQIMPGAVELCELLDSRQIRRGLVTRNVKAAVDLFHQRFGMKFNPALSREFHPYKPDPAPLLHICSTWDVAANEVIMIGDSLYDDVACGKRAGAFTCLLDEKGRYEYFTDKLEPDFKVSSLTEVYSLLDAHFDLAPHYVAEEETVIL